MARKTRAYYLRHCTVVYTWAGFKARKKSLNWSVNSSHSHYFYKGCGCTCVLWMSIWDWPCLKSINCPPLHWMVREDSDVCVTPQFPHSLPGWSRTTSLLLCLFVSVTNGQWYTCCDTSCHNTSLVWKHRLIVLPPTPLSFLSFSYLG